MMRWTSSTVLGASGSAPVGRAEHRLVERVELFGSQPADRDPPEGWEDVAVDLAAVAVEGRRWRG